MSPLFAGTRAGDRGNPKGEEEREVAALPAMEKQILHLVRNQAHLQGHGQYTHYLLPAP
jgi:hypothetical protein